jgi:7-carboxy-7-deazaguanine synthase
LAEGGYHTGVSLILSRMPGGRPEIFASIQGEGASVGLPSTFVRLGICNLRCGWCDTKYTWDWANYDRATQLLTLEPDAVAAEVRALAPRNVVVTGGEPLLQRHGLRPLLQTLRADGYRIEFETNGTVPPGELAGMVDQWNVSPKLAHSGNEGLNRLRPEVLRAFAAEPNSYLKLVVQDPSNLVEIDAIVASAGMPAHRVLLMPEGRTAAELTARSAAIAEICTARGYRFSTRVHIFIWGDKRGV